MHTDSEMTGISRSGSMHYMTAASLEMSDEPYFVALHLKELPQELGVLAVIVNEQNPNLFHPSVVL